MRILTAVLLVFAFASFLTAQDLNDTHEKILTANSERAYATAISELTALEKDRPDIFHLHNYDYLLARTFEKTGDLAAAMRLFQDVANRNSTLKPYALFHLSRITRASANLMLERIYLQELISFAPTSLLRDAAENRLARSLFEGKNYDLAIRAFDRQFSSLPPANAAGSRRQPQSPIARENRVLLAQAYLRTGNAEAARENFTRLITSLDNPAQPDDFALEATKGLDLLDAGPENFGKAAPRLGDFEHLRRAQIYQFNRDFADARLHFAAIIENHPASGNVPDAVYQIGRGYSQQANFAEAVRWFERTLEQFPEHPVSKDALLQAASAYARVSKFNEAITRYQKFIEKYPDDERVDRAYLNIIDILRDQGEEIAAHKWSARVQEVFQGKLPEALAVFADARIYLARSDWQNALVSLEKLKAFPDLGGSKVPGGTSTAEVAFLKAFALEQLSRYEEAIDVYLSIPDGRNEYYGWRATERLKLLADNTAAKPTIEAKQQSLSLDEETRDNNVKRKKVQDALRLTNDPAQRTKLLESLRKIYAALPAYKNVPGFEFVKFGRQEVRRSKQVNGSDDNKMLADELLFLGLYDEAAPEMAASRSNSSGSQPSTAADYTLAVLFARGDFGHKAVAFAEPLWRNIPADYQLELMPREHVEILYPVPYVDSLLKHSTVRGVDPRFLLSIMRQESRYRADIKSYAAARGLMQFISTTADKIAGEVGRPNFRQDDLYDPATSILFGSQYTADLFKMFPGQPQAVAASYNGGEDNMKRWMNRSKSDSPDRYVPEIAFSQSKDYVYKVMANYRIYQTFYDENLKAK